MNKKNLWVSIIFTYAVLCFFSCNSLFNEEEDSQVYLPAPMVTTNSTSVTISCNTSENTLWINVFRSEDSVEPYNIGQIIPKKKFSNSVQFIDNHMDPAKNYKYYIRSAIKDETGIIHSNTKSVSVDAIGSATGEIAVSFSGTITYDGTSVLTFSALPTASQGDACITLSNGKTTLFIPVATTTLELRDLLPEDFIGVPLTTKGLVAQIATEDTKNKWDMYYWSPKTNASILDAADTSKILSSITVEVGATGNTGMDY